MLNQVNHSQPLWISSYKVSGDSFEPDLEIKVTAHQHNFIVISCEEMHLSFSQNFQNTIEAYDYFQMVTFGNIVESLMDFDFRNDAI